MEACKVLFFLVSLLFCVAKGQNLLEGDNNEGVITLTSQSLDEKISSEPLILVEFFAPWYPLSFFLSLSLLSPLLLSWSKPFWPFAHNCYSGQVWPLPETSSGGMGWVHRKTHL